MTYLKEKPTDLNVFALSLRIQTVLVRREQKRQRNAFSEKIIKFRPHIVYTVYWSFQQSPTTVRRMTLISLTSCIIIVTSIIQSLLNFTHTNHILWISDKSGQENVNDRILNCTICEHNSCGASDSMRVCHAAGPGSIPGRDKFPGWGFFGVFPHL